MKLIRYWIEFQLDLNDWSSPKSLLRAGCGVTGSSVDDCLNIIRQRILNGQTLPPVERVIENIDISTLDSNHVIPNMGLVVNRGIWFPTGYD